MLENLKVFVADVDMTLVNDKKILMPITKKAMQMLREQGVYLGIASGRPIAGHLVRRSESWGFDRQFDFIKDSLLAALERDDWEAAFRRITDFRQQTYATLLGRGGIFPYTRKMNNGKTVIIEYVHTFFTLYYGEVDSDNKRNGEGRQMTYAVNYEKAPEQYIEEYLHGNFINDMVNGEFEEFNHVHVSSDSVAHITGMMIDNMYDGKIRTAQSLNGKLREYTFTFNKGIPESLGKLVDFEGDYYAVGVTDDNPPYYYGYHKDSLNVVHGFYPYYEKLH